MLDPPSSVGKDLPAEFVCILKPVQQRGALTASGPTPEAGSRLIVERHVEVGDRINVWSVWTTAAKAATSQWKKDKSRQLRAREDNPCAGMAAPDRDGDKDLQWLYPNEFITLVACEDVPLEFRRLYALVTYLFLRGGELKALTWPDVDIERGIISVRRSYDRNTGGIKQTKTGNKGMRRFAVEPALLPLVHAMHADANGQGPVVDMRQAKVVGRRPPQAPWRPPASSAKPSTRQTTPASVSASTTCAARS